MATVNGVGRWIDGRVHEFKVENLANGDDSSALSLARLNDKTVQVIGTFGTGGTVAIEGSNDDGTTWHVLNDSRGEGNPLEFTTADTRLVLENPQRIRANVTAGDGTTDLTVIIVSGGSR